MMQRLLMKLLRLSGARVVHYDDYSEMVRRAAALEDALERVRLDLQTARVHQKEGRVPLHWVETAFDQVERTLKRERM